MKKVILVGVSLGAVAQSSAFAQDANNQSLALDTIVVTAQKREQNIQDTPLAISAFSGDLVQKNQIRDLGDLTSLAPGFSGAVVSSGQPLVAIRGISSTDFSVGSDPALGVFIDDVYVGRSAGAITNIFDVNRVEVVRGPQGTLFGRNTTAGAISITRNRPTFEIEGAVDVQYAEHNEIVTSGVLSGPIADNIALRGSVYHRRRDGDNPRLLGGDDLDAVNTTSVRLAALFTPNENVEVDLSFDYQRDRSDPAIYQSTSFTEPFTVLGFYDSPQGLTGDEIRNDRDIYMVAAKVAWDLGDFNVTSVSSFRTYQFDYLEDTDGSPARLLAFGVGEEQDAYSQELRLNYDGDKLSWFIGASYFNEKLDATNSANYDEEDICGGVARGSGFPTLPCGVLLNSLSGGAIPVTFTGLPSVTDISMATADYSSYGVYGDATFSATDRLRLIAGVRFSYDKKEVVINNPAPVSSVAPLLLASPTVYLETTAGPVTQSDSWSDVSPRFVTQYDITDNVMGYASVSFGYKSGGFNLLKPTGGAFDPEDVVSYEVGLKGALADRRVVFDVTGFHYRYDNLQLLIVDAFPFTQNAGKSKGTGVELSAQAALTADLTFSGTFAYLDAEFTDYVLGPGVDFTGNRPPRAPKFSGSATIDYSREFSGIGEVGFRGIYKFASENFHQPDNLPERSSPAQDIVDLFVTWAPTDTWTLTVFAKNVFEDETITATTKIDALGIQNFRAGERRSVGAKLAARF